MRKRLDTGIKPSEITPEDTFLNRRTLLQAAVAAGLLPSIMSSGEAATIPADGAFTNVKKWPDSTTEKANTLRRHHDLQQLLRVRHGQERSRRERPHAEDVAVVGPSHRRGSENGHLHARGHPAAARARGAHLSAALCRGVVDGDPVGRVSACRPPEAVRADVASEVRAVLHAQRPHANAGRALCGARLAVPRRPDDRRGDAPARASPPSASTARCCRTRTARRCARVLPWKYGFKSCKSIVRIHFTDRQPETSWNMAAPQEYGFYSNVNPQVDHPRWSQATERRLGRRPFLAAHSDADVQRLWRPGRRAVYGPRPRQELLTPAAALSHDARAGWSSSRWRSGRRAWHR